MSIERLKRNLLFRPLAYLMVLIMAGTPVGNAIAQAVQERPQSATEGQDLGRTLLQSPPTAIFENGQLTISPGTDREQSFSASQLAPGATSFDTDSMSSVYGSNAAMTTGGATAREQMEADMGAAGAAYDIMMTRRLFGQPDMRNDPIWSQTDAAMANIDVFAEEFLDCTTEERVVTVTRSYHVPDLRQCERTQRLFEGTCDLAHEVEVDTIVQEADVPPTTIPTGGGFFLGDSMSLFTPYTREILEELVPPGTVVHIHGITHDGVSYDGQNTVLSLGNWFGDTVPIVFSSGASFPSNVLTYIDGVSPDAHLRIRPDSRIDFKTGRMIDTGEQVTTPLDYNQICNDPDGQYTATVTVGGEFIETPTCDNNLIGMVLGSDETTLIRWHRIRTDTWYWRDPVCENAMVAVRDGVCRAEATCSNAGTGCITVSGVRLCDADLSSAPAPFGHITGSCLNASIQVSCYEDVPEVICDVDFEGNEVCFDTTEADASAYSGTCVEYEQNPQCAFVARECVEEEEEDQFASGSCYNAIETWDCGFSVDSEQSVIDRTVVCAGPVRCMGEDCLEIEREQSTSMEEAIAALQAAQYMISDMDCEDGWDCMVFDGERMRCHRYLWGIQDCCKTPDGVSLADYILLLQAAYKLDQAVGVSDYLLSTPPGGVLRAGYDKIVTEAGNMWSKASSTFTGSSSTVTGSTTAAATEQAASASLSQFKQQMINKTAEWVGNTFGTQVQGMFFETAAGGGFTMTGPISTAAGYIMMAYMYYQIFIILVNILLECDRESQELGVKRELRSCHYVGTRCTDSTVFGTCLRRTSTYCCFNSPLARIINQQVRNQTDGWGWGSARSPDCSGIPLSMFEMIDWARVDLSEWIAILAISGVLPSADNVSIERLTGTDSSLNVSSPERMDAETRTRERLEAIEPFDVHWNATLELFSVPID
jgi:conjugal transfer mating pair stabilization protein TraN